MSLCKPGGEGTLADTPQPCVPSDRVCWKSHCPMQPVFFWKYLACYKEHPCSVVFHSPRGLYSSDSKRAGASRGDPANAVSCSKSVCGLTEGLFLLPLQRSKPDIKMEPSAGRPMDYQVGDKVVASTSAHGGHSPGGGGAVLQGASSCWVSTHRTHKARLPKSWHLNGRAINSRLSN